MVKIVKSIVCCALVSLYMSGHAIAEDKIIFLFSHGIAANKRQAYQYAQITPSAHYNAHHIINNKDHILLSFNYPDAGEGISINRRETSLAQANEIEKLHKMHISIDTKTDIVGLGISRGASVFVTWLGTHPDDAKTQNIQALILESPFDSIDSVLRYIIGESLYKNSTIRAFSHSLVAFVFSKYDKSFITPIEAAAKVPSTIPILIVCSAEDTRVPAFLSKRLYVELRKTGHDKVHFLKLKHGAHGKLIQDFDKIDYRNTVHAFYRKYGLPHNADYAKHGQALLEASQPDF